MNVVILPHGFHHQNVLTAALVHEQVWVVQTDGQVPYPGVMHISFL